MQYRCGFRAFGHRLCTVGFEEKTLYQNILTKLNTFLKSSMLWMTRIFYLGYMLLFMVLLSALTKLISVEALLNKYIPTTTVK